MQQHPIPQNVTQYQFRLVGDMTLKQFLELSSGLLLAYLFFASNLVFIFKWPLIILSVLFGVGLAFFPIEDRPLDQWILNFIRSIYAPTRFTWQKTNRIPRLFLFSAHAPEVVNTITKTIKAPTTTVATKPVSDLSDQETTRLSSLDSIFKSLPSPTISPAAPGHSPITRPTIAVRKLSPQDAVKDVVLHLPTAESTPVSKSSPPPTTTPQAQPTVVFSAPSVPTINHEPSIMSSPRKITLPASPKLPNLVTGVVVDESGKLVENAIVQIVSSDGIPARAMKTNSLGQFYTSTPLSPATYVIEVDKDGIAFSPQQIVVNNDILSPIELRATD